MLQRSLSHEAHAACPRCQVVVGQPVHIFRIGRNELADVEGKCFGKAGSCEFLNPVFELSRCIMEPHDFRFVHRLF